LECRSLTLSLQVHRSLILSQTPESNFEYITTPREQVQFKLSTLYYKWAPKRGTMETLSHNKKLFGILIYYALKYNISLKF
jgi:hypothetical protein